MDEELGVLSRRESGRSDEQARCHVESKLPRGVYHLQKSPFSEHSFHRSFMSLSQSF